MTKKMTITLEDELIDELSETALKLGKKKAQIVREALKEYLPSVNKKNLEEAWLEENREAITADKEHFEKHGIFGSEYRGF